MMVKPKEFRSLVNYYKGNITESTLLNEAARVAAEAKMLIDDKRIEPALKEPRVKHLMRKRGTLVKELRQGAVPSTSTSAPDPTVNPATVEHDEDRNIDSLQERMFKGLAKSVNRRTDALVPQLQAYTQTLLDNRGGSGQGVETPLQARPKRKAAIKKKIITKFPKKGKGKKPAKPTVVEEDSEDSWEAWETSTPSSSTALKQYPGVYEDESDDEVDFDRTPTQKDSESDSE